MANHNSYAFKVSRKLDKSIVEAKVILYHLKDKCNPYSSTRFHWLFEGVRSLLVFEQESSKWR